MDHNKIKSIYKNILFEILVKQQKYIFVSVISDLTKYLKYCKSMFLHRTCLQYDKIT